MPEAKDDFPQRARQYLGRVLCGKYRIDRLIGIGGMASVFAGVHLRNANRVALKILHRESAADPAMRARFLREGYAANSVEHPGTVRVLDDDKAEDGSIFLVMELLDGETLDARFERSGRKLGTGAIVTLLLDVLDIIVAAHEKGVVHRDIKPENLFLTTDGTLKILDFGIARLRKSSKSSTGGGEVLGTPAFMPPEQALGHSDEVDVLSDVWAIGATGFLLLSGEFVHSGTTAAEMVVRTGSQHARMLTSVAPQVPLALAVVIDRALSFNKVDRWPSAKAMRDALSEARTSLVDEVREGDGKRAHPKAPLPSGVVRLVGQARAVPSPSSDVVVTAQDPASSTVAGVASNSEARRVRNRHKRAAVVLGVGAVLAVAFLVAVSGGPTKAPVTALSASPGATNAGEVSVPTAVREMSAAAGATATPWVPVEALPKAASPATATTPLVTPPVSRARSAASAAPPPVPTAAPARKHDPLSPW